jgi:rRNA maturation endonuclease Nob1
MSLIRRLIFAFVSKERAAAMEAESREWILRCEACPREISVWDLGGLRYKASGHPKHRAPCPHCGKKTWHRMTRRPSS